MGRWNGTFQYRNAQEPEKDPQTGFLVGGDGESEWVPGCRCQIDKVMPAKQYVGTDGQEHTYNYYLFIPKPYKCDGLDIGTEVEITMEDGTVDCFTIQGVDKQNRRYIELWG